MVKHGTAMNRLNLLLALASLDLPNQRIFYGICWHLLLSDWRRQPGWSGDGE